MPWRYLFFKMRCATVVARAALCLRVTRAATRDAYSAIIIRLRRVDIDIDYACCYAASAIMPWLPIFYAVFVLRC